MQWAQSVSKGLEVVGQEGVGPRPRRVRGQAGPSPGRPDTDRGGPKDGDLQRENQKRPSEKARVMKRDDRIRSGARYAVLLIGTLLLLAACTAGPNELTTTDPEAAGFWLGLWQGLISPITFVVSLFNANVGIYEVNNNGNWYNFGFMLGVACAFSGGGGASGAAAGSRRKGTSK